MVLGIVGFRACRLEFAGFRVFRVEGIAGIRQGK